MIRLLPALLTLASLSPGLVSPALAQEPQSAAPARQLAQLLTDRKLDSFAARVPGSPDEFAAVLSFPGQLIVVWARFSAPSVLNEKLLNREFREAYIDLNSASIPESRHFITDVGADGLGKGARNQPADSHDQNTTSIRFTGNWRELKMSEKDYMSAHAEADVAYGRILGILIEELKKSS